MVIVNCQVSRVWKHLREGEIPCMQALGLFYYINWYGKTYLNCGLHSGMGSWMVQAGKGNSSRLLHSLIPDWEHNEINSLKLLHPLLSFLQKWTVFWTSEPEHPPSPWVAFAVCLIASIEKRNPQNKQQKSLRYQDYFFSIVVFSALHTKNWDLENHGIFSERPDSTLTGNSFLSPSKAEAF